MLQCHVSSQTVVEILKSCQYEPHTTLMTGPRYRGWTAPYYTQILSNDMWDVELLNQRKCPINYLPRHNRDDGHSILTLNTVKNHSGPLTFNKTYYYGFCSVTETQWNCYQFDTPRLSSNYPQIMMLNTCMASSGLQQLQPGWDLLLRFANFTKKGTSPCTAQRNLYLSKV